MYVQSLRLTKSTDSLGSGPIELLDWYWSVSLTGISTVFLATFASFLRLRKPMPHFMLIVFVLDEVKVKG